MQQKIWSFTVLFILVFSSLCYAGEDTALKEYIGEGTYQAGDHDTPSSAEDAAMLLAKRSVLEQAGTLVTSSTTIKNFITQDDTIRSLSAGVMQITVLDKRRTQVGNGMEFWIKIRAVIDPIKLEQIINPPLITRNNQNKPNIIDNETQNKLLIYGVENNNIEIVQKAIDNGANVNIYENNNHYYNALTLAITKQNIEIVTCLLKNGADVNSFTIQPGWIPEMRITPLIVAAEKPNLLIIQKLIEFGADVNFKNPYYLRTALFEAIKSRNADQIVPYLITQGADLNSKNRDGQTPLMKAVYESKPKVFKILINAGADSSLKDNEGKTALSIALRQKELQIIELLSSTKSSD